MLSHLADTDIITTTCAVTAKQQLLDLQSHTTTDPSYANSASVALTWLENKLSECFSFFGLATRGNRLYLRISHGPVCAVGVGALCITTTDGLQAVLDKGMAEIREVCEVLKGGDGDEERKVMLLDVLIGDGDTGMGTVVVAPGVSSSLTAEQRILISEYVRHATALRRALLTAYPKSYRDACHRKGLCTLRSHFVEM